MKPTRADGTASRPAFITGAGLVADGRTTSKAPTSQLVPAPTEREKPR